MTTKKKIVWPALVASCLAVVLFLWIFLDSSGSSEARDLRRAGRDISPARKPLRCGFKLNHTLAFSLSMQSQFTVEPTTLLPDRPRVSTTPPLTAGNRTLTADFLWRVVSEQPTADGVRSWMVAAALRDASVIIDNRQSDATETAALEEPFLFKIDERCQLHGVGVSNSSAEFAIREWQLLLSFAELILPKGTTHKKWQVLQSDSTGRYHASYRFLDSQTLPRIERRRVRYVEVNSPNANVVLNAIILASDTNAAFDSEAGWFQNIQSREHLAVETDEGRRFADVDTRMSLRTIEATPGDTLWAAGFQPDDFSWREISDLAQDKDAAGLADGPKVPGIAQLDLNDVLSQFEDRLRGVKSMDQALAFMLQYLKSDPEHIELLLDAIRNGHAADELHAPLFLALELTGGTVARDALIEATRDPKLSPMNRLRAISALQDVAEPDEKVVRAIQVIWEDSGSKSNDETRSALLALGSLSSKQQLPVAIRNELTGLLDTALLEAQDSPGVVNALSAMGNAKRASFADAARSYLDSDNANERAAALDTLRRIGQPLSVGEAVDAIRNETSPRAQHELGSALVSRAKETSDEELAEAIAILHAPDCSITIREELIRFLGQLVDTHPAARQGLIDHFQNETDKDLLALIGRFVDPAEL